MSRRRAARWLVAVTVLLVGCGWCALPYAESAALILDVAGSSGGIRRWLPGRTVAVTSADREMETRHGPIAVRVYRPAVTSSRTVMVFPGVHAGGLDEPRLVTFASRLAATGLTVVAAPLPDLRRYQITPRSTDEIEDLVARLDADASLAPSGRVSLVGVSFAGALALVAAGRPSIRDHVASILSISGYGDLPRALTFVCTGRLSDGRVHATSDYAADVLLLPAIDLLVPPAERDPLRQAVLAYLDAASAEGTDPARAQALVAEAQAEGAVLAEPAHTLMGFVLARDARALGPRLLPFVEVLGGDPALSPDRSPAATAPVFLLQGEDDDVMPPSETPEVAAYLEAHGNRHVEWLLSPVLSHVAVDTHVPLRDAWRLIRFWTDALASPS